MYRLLSSYLENPVGIGEHSDLLESVDVEVRKYNEAKELLASVANLIEFYKKKDEQRKAQESPPEPEPAEEQPDS